MSFQTGDIVVLKSGGPEMTVDFIVDTDVTCNWFSDNKLHNETFNEASLKKYTPPGPMRLTRS